MRDLRAASRAIGAGVGRADSARPATTRAAHAPGISSSGGEKTIVLYFESRELHSRHRSRVFAAVYPPRADSPLPSAQSGRSGSRLLVRPGPAQGPLRGCHKEGVQGRCPRCSQAWTRATPGTCSSMTAHQARRKIAVRHGLLTRGGIIQREGGGRPACGPRSVRGWPPLDWRARGRRERRW
jgi:hypothetical protein